MKKIKVLYHDTGIEKINKINQGDWIDLRCAEDTILKAGESTYLSLGISMELPKGYEAHIAPRSSVFKNYGLLQTNGVAVIDNSYCGDEDIWKMPVYATRDTEIKKNDRICQFRIMLKMPSLEFEEVESLGNKNRSGFGSTGKA